MTTAIHIEFNTLCLLVLFFISYQSRHNVNQQMRRILFRTVMYGVIVQLVPDNLWLLVEGRLFPGARAANLVINALFLSAGVILGCFWYLYVLETLGYPMTYYLETVVMLPGFLFTFYNIISIWTGWSFTVSPDNVYAHGPLFSIQMVGAYGMLLVSFVHLILRLFTRRKGVRRRVVYKLLGFYVIPVIGSVISLFYTGMPGTWTCAAISIMLIYIDDLDSEVLRDGLTGLNNRKALDNVFADYTRQISTDNNLYLFMMDLDHFKKINDTLGHSTGDQALVNAAKILSGSLRAVRGILVRYGGDEFLIMAFFKDDAEADAFRQKINDRFASFNVEQALPYRLAVSIGFASWSEGVELGALIHQADEQLYLVKQTRR